MAGAEVEEEVEVLVNLGIKTKQKLQQRQQLGWS